MRRIAILFMIVALAGLLCPVNAISRNRERARAEVVKQGRGFYKDIFMDGGIYLTSRRTLPATDFLGLSLEFFASNKNKELTQQDTLIQTNIFCGSREDTNGWLLYPDGAPRFRVVYVNGGKANNHGKSLSKQGRANLCKYVANGGSYLGTCAGAYLASSGGYSRKGARFTRTYLGLWPAYAHSTHLTKSRTSMSIPKKSPLLRYFDFGGDRVVADVRHNGGCYGYWNEDKPFPKGGEILSYYIFNNRGKVQIDGKPSVWAYKADKYSGRTISCGSHPEGVKDGERLEYMSAMVLYAMEGNGVPKPKGELKGGEVREMNKRTEDNNPARTCIGDRQYHHFALDVPKRCRRAVVTLEGYEGEDNFDLLLYAKRGELAFSDNAAQKSTGEGCAQSLTITKPKAGRWYVSVFCETTITATTGKFGTEYSGRTDVLNGVPYKISVRYE